MKGSVVFVLLQFVHNCLFVCFYIHFFRIKTTLAYLLLRQINSNCLKFDLKVMQLLLNINCQILPAVSYWSYVLWVSAVSHVVAPWSVLCTNSVMSRCASAWERSIESASHLRRTHHLLRLIVYKNRKCVRRDLSSGTQRLRGIAGIALCSRQPGKIVDIKIIF